MKKLITAVFCTAALLVTMGADSSGCSAPPPDNKPKSTKRVESMATNKAYTVTRARSGTWIASSNKCKWLIVPEKGHGKDIRGGRGYGGTNRVTLNHKKHAKFTSTNCGLWVKK